MTKADFYSIIEAVIANLYETAKNDPESITSCKTGDDFELCVKKALEQVILSTGTKADILYTAGSHVFPDIIILSHTGEKYGIEVKSSTTKKGREWKINGNSVMGSTRGDEVIETYIVFGKSSMLEFKAKNYEECVANVVVTHSPRYLIDMDLAADETFFEKSGITYKDITTSDNPISLITKYFQEQGHKAWWLSESTPAAVRMFSDVSIKEQNECFGHGLAHFPELFERNATKYKRLALWMATERSIVASSLRDDFSAGGQVNMIVNGMVYNKLPQIYYRLLQYKDYLVAALDAADPDELCKDWGVKVSNIDSLDKKIDAWIRVVTPHVCTNQLNKDIIPGKLIRDIITHQE